MIVRCPLNSMLGYGHVSMNICTALANKTDVLVNPIGPINITHQPHQNTIYESIEKFALQYSHKLPCLTIWHETDLVNNFVGKSIYTSLPFFEVNKLDAHRQFHFGYCDNILVASQWAKDVLESNHIDRPIHIVPMGVDTSLFYPQNNQPNKYKFFTVGKAEYRKGTELMVEIFCSLFANHDDVEFYILGDSPLKKIQSLYNHIKKQYSVPNVKFLSNFQTDEQYARFLREMDCGIFLTRAEGFGAPIAQAIACGKPVITTDYSAHTEFCNQTNSFLVNINKLVPAIDGIWFFGLGTWADIGTAQIKQCKDYMIHCYKNRPKGGFLDPKFTWQNCANKILEVMS